MKRTVGTALTSFLLIFMFAQAIHAGGSLCDTIEGKPVIVFIHGAASSPSRFDWLAGKLAKAGWTDQLRFAYDSRDEWVEEAAHRLAAFVAERTADDRRVVIIAHSLGGIVARYYVEFLGGAGKTDALVLLGTPNRGTKTADNLRLMYQTDFVEKARLDGKPLQASQRILLRIMISSLWLEYGERAVLQISMDSPLIARLNSKPLPAGLQYLVVVGTSAEGGILGHYEQLNRLQSRLGLPLPRPNDGLVPVASATIPAKLGRTEVLRVRASHIALTFNKPTLEAIVSLLNRLNGTAVGSRD